MARFVQPDSVVPVEFNSQALNRYAYVRNNPLKFSDPTGHGWFSKFVNKWLGAIITVALTAMGVPLPISSMIGSAVGAAVNGGTFKSFAIGVGIGIASGLVAVGLGNSIFGEVAWGNFISKPIGIGAALQGALQGSAGGAISSAVYGMNVWKGMGEGALAGLTGAGVAIALEPMNAGIKWITGNPAKLRITTKNNESPYVVKIYSIKDFDKIMQDVIDAGDQIMKIEWSGHGLGGKIFGRGTRGFGLEMGKTDVLWKGSSDYLSKHFYSLAPRKGLITQAIAPNATIELESCYSASIEKNIGKYDPKSIAHSFKEIFPGATVRGFTTKAWNVRGTFMTGPKFYGWKEVK